jgi:hypothetical protein
MSDFLTILKCQEDMTKRWQADGGIKPYDLAALFRVLQKPVGSLQELHELLRRLQREPHCCAIRGQFVGHEEARARIPEELPIHYRRQNKLFEEAGHYHVMIDIDGFRPHKADPVRQPVKAIDEYVHQHLPSEFHGKSYSWQLSGSAGFPGKEGLLKAHVWFWLTTPYTGPSLTEWARATGAELDVSVFRRVQPLYTAAPLFDEGVVDPVPVRIGFEQGWDGDVVDLIIPDEVLEKARHYENDKEIELVDPKDKAGVIGAFCRAFSLEETIRRWLPDVFEFQDGSERRLNFLRGSGAPGGAFVTPDREYVVSMHASDPLGGRASNKWDLVRKYTFGDRDVGSEELSISRRPSQQAMLQMAIALPEVATELAKRTLVSRDQWQRQIEAAVDEVALRGFANEVSRSRQLDALSREHLIGVFKKRFKEMGVKIGVALLRDLVGCAARKQKKGAVSPFAPDWAKPWVYVTDQDKFFNLETKEKVSMLGFDARHTRFMENQADPESHRLPPASRFCLEHWNLPCVTHIGYMPPAGPIYEMLGFDWANKYNPAAVPPPEDCPEAISLVEAHLMNMFPDARERQLLLSWLAHNVQLPGVKIRWSPYVHGCEGDGKSFYVDLLAATMGAANVRTLSSSTLEHPFTDWASGYAAIGIEEMKMHGHNRYDIMNRLKPHITNSTIEIHPKGKASYSAPNTTNFLILSNYLDGAPITEGDRRYCFFSSALDKPLVRRLTKEGYFSHLFQALATHPGALRKWLLNYPLAEEFDPNGQAPLTEIKATVIDLSYSDTDILAQDLIEEGQRGIHPTVVCAGLLANAIREVLGEDAKVSTSQLNGLLSRLGFRALGRKFWAGRKHFIWVMGSDITWAAACECLDQTR